MSDLLGIYVHIPYCLQRCSYCDFATFVSGETIPQDEYFRLLHSEIDNRQKFYSARELTSLYFGGGTPSLAKPEDLLGVIDHLKSLGFRLGAKSEVTLEVNPATIDYEKLSAFRQIGINRFSLGAQTFHDHHLKHVQRLHTAQDTIQTAELLNADNRSLDLLFALPNQSLEELRSDLAQFLLLNPNHISPYILTLKDHHPLNQNRPSDETQIEFFEEIRRALIPQGYTQYEISNYAKPGFESQHNLLYWTNQEFWGLGLSAHSYRKNPAWGLRFWNPSSMSLYSQEVLAEKNLQLDQPKAHFEVLQPWELLTDLCHTFLRLQSGLSWEKLPVEIQNLPGLQYELSVRLERIMKLGLLTFEKNHWVLTPKGQHLSNQVFLDLTFSAGDLNIRT